MYEYTELTAYYTMVNTQQFNIQWISDMIWIPVTNIKPMKQNNNNTHLYDNKMSADESKASSWHVTYI
jgi:hypothetical protein